MEDKHSAPVEGWETLTEIIEEGREDELVSIMKTSFQIHQPNLPYFFFSHLSIFGKVNQVYVT